MLNLGPATASPFSGKTTVAPKKVAFRRRFVPTGSRSDELGLIWCSLMTSSAFREPPKYCLMPDKTSWSAARSFRRNFFKIIFVENIFSAFAQSCSKRSLEKWIDCEIFYFLSLSLSLSLSRSVPRVEIHPQMLGALNRKPHETHLLSLSLSLFLFSMLRWNRNLPLKKVNKNNFINKSFKC